MIESQSNFNLQLHSTYIVSLEANGNAFEIVKSAKILGVTVRSDLKWIEHVHDITMKASQRIYLPKQLKCTGIDRKSLTLF